MIGERSPVMSLSPGSDALSDRQSEGERLYL